VRTRPALVALGALVVTLAACSGGSSHPAATTSTRAKVAAAVSATAAKPSAGCRAAPVRPGEEKVTIESGGETRWFFRHVPPSYTGTTPMPVVVDIHGYAEGAAIHERMTELGAYGDAHGFVTITPQGAGPVARWNTTLGGPDVKFVGDLLDSLDRTLCVDDRRVFVTGLSNGAFMTSAVACAYADRVAAVAPVAGIQDIAGCAPARPVPVVAFHGTADPFVAYTGGLGPKALQLPAPDGSGRTLGESGLVANATGGPSIPAITAAWARRNGCAATPTERTIAAEVTLIRYRCPPGGDVELYRITGGGHSWPGSAFSRAIVAVVGPTTTSISADDVIWRFFTGHPLAGA
jgi:polyhydroxybutyrate depolymerase